MGWIFAVVAGLLTGILSGFGVGGGTLLLLWLTTFGGMTQQQAQGINLLYFLPAASAALPSHWNNGYVERSLLLPAIAAGLAAAALTAWLAAGLDTGLLRRFFGGFLLVVGIRELLRP